MEPDEVWKVINDLDISKSGDIFNITPKLIKIGNAELHDKLTALYNKSFSSGIFPNILKEIKVIPIHKGESKLLTNNYRPISLLPIIGKILEKLMYTRLNQFLAHHNIISNTQYGFQKGKCTEQAIFDLQSKIINALENGEYPCCIFLDFAKAFDTVDKDILLFKLNHYGIRGNTLNWINSYLTGRNQKVQVGNTLS